MNKTTINNNPKLSAYGVEATIKRCYELKAEIIAMNIKDDELYGHYFLDIMSSDIPGDHYEATRNANQFMQAANRHKIEKIKQLAKLVQKVNTLPQFKEHEDNLSPNFLF